MVEDKTAKAVGAATMAVVIGVLLLQYVQRMVVVRAEVEYPEPYGALWLFPAGHIMNVSYGEGDEPEYFGEAMPGTLDSETGWRIYRYEYETIEGDLEIARLRFAGGNTNFDKVWDDREDYEYS